MLIEMQVKDFAIMDEVTLHFARGFNVITGETGAGKSILIDAMDFALGGHSDSGFIRSGAEKAMVTLTFQVPPFLRGELRSQLEGNDIPVDDHKLQLTREIRANGRSVAKINGAACKIALYSEVGAMMVDIHGQTEHLSLLKSRNHIYLLDSFADLVEPREAVTELVRKLNDIRRTMASLRQSERERAHRIEMLKYQISEIETARLKDGEEVELREERQRLGNSEKLATLSDEVYEALYGEDAMGRSGIDALNQASVALSKLAALDDSMKEDSVQAETLVAQAEDLARSIHRYREHLEVSPSRLETVEERLEAITRLKRKYGESIKTILEYAERAKNELNDIEMGEERLAELQIEEEKLLHSIGDLAKSLSEGRRRAGERLSGLIVEQLGHLRMEGTRFEVSIVQEDDHEGCFVDGERLAFDSTGIDKVEFLMSANPGEPLRPVAKVASGGETARIMLALKTVLSSADRTPTLIFDEIDQGIGGRVGGVVGEKLWGLSTSHQVLCVTHLAQIAGFADNHFRVTKGVKGNRTATNVIKLAQEARINEMAEMLGSLSESSRHNAEELYAAAEQIKREERTPAGQQKLM